MAIQQRTARLELCDVGCRYGTTDALRAITAVLRPGVTCVVGANGSGKSTLLDIVAGYRAPSAGTVEGSGFDPSDTIREVGYLPQTFGFSRGMTILETVLLSLWLRGFSHGESTRRSRDALAAVGLMDESGKRIGRASGGMVRRTGFAVAIAHDPTLLVLDEPTTGVDAAQRRAMREIISAQSSQRIVMMSSHIAEDIAVLAETMLILKDGRQVFLGTPDEALASGGVPDLESAIIALSA